MKRICMVAWMLVSVPGLAQTSAPLPNNLPTPAAPSSSGNIVARLQPEPGARPSRPQQPGPHNPTQLTYSLTVTNAAEYLIQALVRTPGPVATSLLVNIDAQPHEPEMLWDVPPTTNFQSRLVTWRGTNTQPSAQPAPRYFTLAPGNHLLRFQPRSPEVQLQTVTLHPRPERPTGLKVVTTPPPPPTNLRVVAH